ncbi:hypothetical protein BDZ97DRAFT_1920564 [Flammula alnicola]|nr:hypothetical protein BDZ97DRAFT_1920564 [Flammula alnicola]
MSLDAVTPAKITLGHDLLAFKRYYVGMASLLAYDYCLTIGRNCEKFGQERDQPYSTSTSCCDRFAIVKWLETLLVVIPAESVLVIRTFALTNRNNFVVVFLCSIMIVQCCVVFYAMSQPGKNRALQTPSQLGDPYHVCILFSDPKMDTAYLGVSILFDFTVFLLTIFRTVNFQRKVLPTTTLLRTILQDGALYFAVILSGNIVWMICALVGRPGLKLMNAQPSTILTSIMITRLNLSLRNAGQGDRTAMAYSWPEEGLVTT